MVTNDSMLYSDHLTKMYKNKINKSILNLDEFNRSLIFSFHTYDVFFIFIFEVKLL